MYSLVGQKSVDPEKLSSDKADDLEQHFFKSYANGAHIMLSISNRK